MATREAWSERIFRVMDHIQTHLDEDIAPAELAELAGFSIHHFHRVFRGMTGESVMGFVRRLRLERAAVRLKYGADTVTHVALGVGYQSHEAFTRAFQAQFGVAPSLYRERSAAELPVPPIVLRQEPPRCVIAHRSIGPYEQCFAAWERVLCWAREQRLAGQHLPGIGLCYDDPDVTEASKIRYDACLVLSAEEAQRVSALPQDFSRKEVPGGLYAVATHRGPYDDIENSYVALIGKWLPRRGVELSDEPVVEVYLRSLLDAPPPDWLTEITVRVAADA